MKSTILLLTLVFSIFFSIGINAQDLDWAENHVEGNPTSGSTVNFASVTESIKDYDNNIVSVGRFYGEIDMDPGAGVDIHISRYPQVNSVDYYQGGFIKKTDSQGNYIWTKSFVSTGLVTVSDVAVDANGDYYVTGSFNGAFFKDSTIIGNGPLYNINSWSSTNSSSTIQYVVFVLKMSSEGDILWFKKFGDGPSSTSGGDARGRAIAVDSTGNVYVTGTYNNRNNFLSGNNIASAGKNMAYIVRLNAANGTTSYFNDFGSIVLGENGGAEGTDLTLDFSNGINYPVLLMCGKFAGTADFNFSGLSSGTNILNSLDGELFVIKLDLNSGGLPNSWVNHFSEYTTTKELKLAIDSDGNSYVSHEEFIHKISNLGDYLWFNRVFFTTINDISISSDGVIHSVGTFSSPNANFTGVLNSTPYTLQKGSGTDVFIRKMDTAGTFIWARSLISRLGENVSSILTDESGFYLYGNYIDSVDFNLGADTTFLFKTPYSSPSYLAKYSRCNNIIDTVQLYSCYSIVYEGVTMNNTGQYYVAEHFYEPCDSVEIVNFTRGVNTSRTLIRNGCIPYTLNNQSYAASGTYTQVIPNAAGCDSTITLVLTALNSPTTALTIMQNDTICSGQQITAMASGANSYSWNINNSTSANNTFSFPEQPLAYDAQVIVTGTTENCSLSDTILIHVKPLPEITISGDLAICNGETTTVSASGGDAYSWSNNTNGLSAVLSPSVTTNYNVTGLLNGCSGTTNFQVVVTNYPTLTLTPDTSICLGQNIDLEISGANTYQWDNDLGTAASVNVSPTTTTTYSVTGITNNCSSEAQLTVTFNNQNAPVLVVSSDTTICQFSSAEISVSGAESYIWNQSLGNNTSHNVTPSVSTSYSVVGGSNGCYAEAIIEVTVLNNPIPLITLLTDELSTGSFASYQWYLNGDIIPNGNTQTIIPSSNGIYTVEVVNANGCSNISSEFMFSSLSIEHLDHSTINIYPNPTSEIITISSSVVFSKIEVINVLGQVVSIFDALESKHYALRLPDENGIYLLKIYTAEGLAIKPIVKQ
jgi:hypothetical protein